MRPLAIVCDALHAEEIRRGLSHLSHPAVLSHLIFLLPIDVAGGSDFRAEQTQLIAWINASPNGVSEHPLLCFTRSTGKALRLESVATALGIESKIETSARLGMRSARKGQSLPLQSLLNQCGLSLKSASSEMLSHWAHSRVDRAAVDQWVEQYCRLGAPKWIGEALLGATLVYEQSKLGEIFDSAGFGSNGYALCVNRDPRGNAKSGQVVANLLVKRHEGVRIHDSPAEAIEDHGVSKLVIFEDGLWSGTEAVGVIESLVGLREEGRLKTARLRDAAALYKPEIVLAYGIATDYGSASVRRFLDDNKLDNVRVWSGQSINVTSPELLSIIGARPDEAARLRRDGPPANEMRPHAAQVLRVAAPDQASFEAALTLVASVGRQLFDGYLDRMRLVHGWSSWPEEKRAAATFGMHGMGLTHAFGHSVPKATLPLLWAEGDVTFKGRTLKWQPLFRNA